MKTQINLVYEKTKLMQNKINKVKNLVNIKF